MDDSEYLKTYSKGIFEALNSRDFSTYENILQDTAILDFPGAGEVLGHRKIVVFLRAVLRRYKNLEFKIKEVIIDLSKDKVCVVWNNEGELVDGSLYQNSGITLVHFKNKKIIYISDFFKDTSFTNKISQ